MRVDDDLLTALSETLTELDHDPQSTIPSEVIRSLAPFAKPGMRLRVDLEASRMLGAPLITLSDQRRPDGLLDPLTARQRQVAELVIQGLSNKAIAAQLSISPATVKDHVHAILQRLGFPNRVALITAARNSS